ncbi:MAG: histidine--tRNA ligase [Thermoplasmatales archaeon B_DKE]|nr:MAG: histidine--tRNA ligase [Thermoplasmatales archaeon B_DKE]QRF75187.1 Histidine--tRNA ligase [Thermoplasmatales archaeon]
MTFERVRGFRDHYPEDMMPRKNVFNTAEATAESLGFRKVDFPSLEYLDLYRLKSGEELVGQTFSFVDKGGREVTMIPEATPSVVRMITARKDLVKPIRWYSIPKIFRYEEPQSGRFREHYQFNADIFGVDSPEADAEIIGLAGTILDKLGLGTRYEIRISSRPLLEAILKSVGCRDVQYAFAVIDRFRKIEKAEFFSEMAVAGVEPDNVNTLYGMISSTLEPGDIAAATAISGNVSVETEISRIQYIAELVSRMILSPVKVDLSIVRGLAYYTGVVFEAYDVAGKHRAILGGGRYNGLAALMSDQDIPAVGFGMGDAVIELLMKEEGKWLYTTDKPLFYVCCASPESRKYAFSVSKQVRDSGGITIDELSSRGLSAQLRNAAAEKCDYAVIIGEREEKSKSVTFRNLNSGDQIEVGYEDIDRYVRSRLEGKGEKT